MKTNASKLKSLLGVGALTGRPGLLLPLLLVLLLLLHGRRAGGRVVPDLDLHGLHLLALLLKLDVLVVVKLAQFLDPN